MTPAQHQRAMEIFQIACDLPSDQRAARIAELAAGDEAVCKQAERLLAHDDSTMMDQQPAALRKGLDELLGAAASRPEVHEADLPAAIGQYRILRRVGSGGMGDVYEALQETPRRSVAIKLMRSGLGSEVMVRRFRREVEFLGRLSHPCIARVYEAGVTAIGAAQVPYYVMEYVDGLPLTQFASQRQLSVKDKLLLFAVICDAVQYAHQQGIIHRDLKPANILIPSGPATAVPRLAGETGEASVHGPGGLLPRILDFGIARAVEIDGASAVATMATGAGQVIGTVPYMSPEQFSSRPGEVDTRTDVYALGVLLFELLTGQLPLATDGLSISEAANLKARATASRLSAINRSFRGDLETIVGKALETEKDRRYATASELALDVRRFLANEVIAARPASALYQISKFARRNRAVVALGAVAAIALVGGAIATAMQARIAMQQRDVAIEKTRIADQKTEIAAKKTEVAEAITSVLLNTLAMATPQASAGKEPLLIEAVEAAEAKALDEAADFSPEARAALLQVTGLIWRQRGDTERAERLFMKTLEIRRKALAPDDPNLADTLNELGLVRRTQQRMAEAVVFYQEAVDIQRKSSFVDEPRLARNIFNLGSAYVRLGNVEKGKPLIEESLLRHRRMVGEENEVIAMHLSAKCRIAMAENRWKDAEDLAQQAADMCKRTIGPVHASIANTLIDLGIIVAHNGDRRRAIALLIESDVMAHKVFARDLSHPLAKKIRDTLVELLRADGQVDEATRLENDINALPASTENGATRDGG